MRKAYKILVIKLEGIRHTWADNIKKGSYRTRNGRKEGTSLEYRPSGTLP
jgi:hypothetical protein